MGIVYPNGIDVFNVPTLPEETSLSSAGTATRNHTQLHDDVNKAVVALQNYASKRDHDHSGDAADTSKGGKLKQVNTHQDVDTDASLTAIHHTLGYGAFQAAPGNHTHSIPTQNPIPQNFQICTSSTRPTPWLGMMIFETDTNQLKIWARTASGTPDWAILFGATAAAPPDVAVSCRLRQGLKQKLVAGGTTLEWHEELEDTLNFFNPAASLTAVTVRRAGLYQVECSIAWDPQIVPDQARMVVCINGVDTAVQGRQFMRGNLFTPGFSQTLSASGQLKFNADDVLTVKVSFEAPSNILGQIFSFVEGAVSNVFGTGSKVTSRLDMTRLGA